MVCWCRYNFWIGDQKNEEEHINSVETALYTTLKHSTAPLTVMLSWNLFPHLIWVWQRALILPHIGTFLLLKLMSSNLQALCADDTCRVLKAKIWKQSPWQFDNFGDEIQTRSILLQDKVIRTKTRVSLILLTH